MVQNYVTVTLAGGGYSDYIGINISNIHTGRGGYYQQGKHLCIILGILILSFFLNALLIMHMANFEH